MRLMPGVSKTSKLVTALTLFVSSSAYSAGAGNTGGGCYNLQIIGTREKSAEMIGANGHVIFVPIGGSTKIGLKESSSFQVLDANGTDGNGAAFTLPNPDPTNSGNTAYSVFARLVGKPGSGLNMATCASDALGEVYCSQDTLRMSRQAGSSKFVNVSQQLLYIYADIDVDGDIDRVPLFDSRLADYYWQTDSVGRVHAQLRFCPVSTQVAAP